jgi:hypothetical protein
MIKFNTLDLDGYGFDLVADRVVRFNKHPDGTYLNTRATYSINKKQFTHFDLRTQAIKDRPLGEMPVEKPLHKTYKKWMIVAIFLLVIVSLGECSFEASSNVTVENTQ